MRGEAAADALSSSKAVERARQESAVSACCVRGHKPRAPELARRPVLCRRLSAVARERCRSERMCLGGRRTARQHTGGEKVCPSRPDTPAPWRQGVASPGCRPSQIVLKSHPMPTFGRSYGKGTVTSRVRSLKDPAAEASVRRGGSTGKQASDTPGPLTSTSTPPSRTCPPTLPWSCHAAAPNGV